MKYLIHVEKIWNDVVWQNLLEFIRKQKKNCHLFLMAPQYEYQKAVLGYRGTKQELERVLKQRYKRLKVLKTEYNFKVGIHIHFCLWPEELVKEEKKRIFDKYQKWISGFFDIKSIAFGWFKLDGYLIYLCLNKSLEIKHYDFFAVNLHDYDLPISKLKIMENFLKDNLRILLR
ncbi:hypothetical protein LCGC14_1324860 [marine sediment metagenome]|uniref:Glycoside hydrolase family 57 N-terminal domain-containing protein n=1 Tax=marine sediment metagenome TaxID=412755 RepID=A0A0F9KIZ6_9ZZZZ